MIIIVQGNIVLKEKTLKHQVIIIVQGIFIWSHKNLLKHDQRRHIYRSNGDFNVQLCCNDFYYTTHLYIHWTNTIISVCCCSQVQVPNVINQESMYNFPDQYMYKSVRKNVTNNVYRCNNEKNKMIHFDLSLSKVYSIFSF